MCDLEELENQPVAPVSSMLAKATTTDVIHTSRVEQFWNPTLHHVPKTKFVHHAGELIIT
jgi:hypothetical protein